MTSMTDRIRRGAGRPAPSEEERRQEQRRAGEWASLPPAEKLQQAIDRAAARARPATEKREAKR